MQELTNEAITTRFVLLSMARSGTSAMISALKQHPEIYGHGEIYHNSVRKGIGSAHVHKAFWNGHSESDIDIKSPEFAYKILDFSPGEKIVGFKMWYGQNPIACKQLMQDSRVKKIVLERENRLAMYSSLLLAQQTNIWGSKNQETKQDTEITEFDADAFLEYVRRADAIFEKYKTLCDDQTLFIKHADIATDAMPKTQQFLGVSTDGTTVFMERQNPRDVLARFSNETHKTILDCLEQLGKPEWTND